MLFTNNGTGEHIFNQLSVFQNMHNLCKVGGFMLHVLPFQKHCDHGFYNFQPNLFAALAEQNDYVLDRSFISNAMWTHNTPAKFTVNRQKSLADDCDAYNWGKWDPESISRNEKNFGTNLLKSLSKGYKKDIAEKNIELITNKCDRSYFLWYYNICYKENHKGNIIMSHEVETMAYAGQVPWHGLGSKVRQILPPLRCRNKQVLTGQ